MAAMQDGGSRVGALKQVYDRKLSQVELERATLEADRKGLEQVLASVPQTVPCTLLHILYWKIKCLLFRNLVSAAVSQWQSYEMAYRLRLPPAYL